MPSFEARPFCWDCRRPLPVCLCARAEAFHSGLALTVLEHHLEARSTIGTARILRRFARDARVLPGRTAEFEAHPELEGRIATPGWASAVLFPSPGALDLSRCSPEDARSVFTPGLRPHVVVVDGTWNKASGILRRCRALAGLPRIAFTPDRESSYLIRKQPRPVCWSTLEATVEVIDRLDRLGVAPAPPGRAHHKLLDALDYLVETQLRYRGRPRSVSRSPRAN